MASPPLASTAASIETPTVPPSTETRICSTPDCGRKLNRNNSSGICTRCKCPPDSRWAQADAAARYCACGRQLRGDAERRTCVRCDREAKKESARYCACGRRLQLRRGSDPQRGICVECLLLDQGKVEIVAESDVRHVCEAHLQRQGVRVPAYALGLCSSCFRGKVLPWHSERIRQQFAADLQVIRAGVGVLMRAISYDGSDYTLAVP